MLEWILIVDSGMGGKMVYSKIKKHFPSENYIVFIDKNYCPYGNKSRKQLKEHIINVFNYFFQHYRIKIVVLACNTLSSMFKDFIKTHFKNIVFLFYEPLITNKILQNPTLVLATTNTIKYSKIIKKYKTNQNCYLVGFPSLAKMIDDNSKGIQEYLIAHLSNLKDINIKNIVLGCTHYEAIIPNLKLIFGDINFVEKTPLVIERLSKILLEHKGKGKTLFFDYIKE